MLADTFPMLLGGNPAPRDPLVYECSRLCVDTERAELLASGGLRQTTSTLVAGVGQWANSSGVKQIVSVTDLTVERILLRAGCWMTRLGEPMRIGVAKAVACIIDTSDAGVDAVFRTVGIPGGPIMRPAAPALERRSA